MAVGSYGIIRPADVSPDDVEIFYHYVSGRTSTAPVSLKTLNSSSVLTPVYHGNDTTDDTNAPNLEVLGGLYNLKLESDKAIFFVSEKLNLSKLLVSRFTSVNALQFNKSL